MTRTLKPLVVLGAARSGTKIMRDTLSTATGVPAVPFDIGYVWRYGNEAIDHDCLSASDIRPRTRRLVASYLDRYADSDGRLIEKTVGNTLRVGYVSELLPNAHYVHLVRNGVDVAESTRRQWQEPADIGYLRDKIRHFPLRAAPTYGRRYALSLMRRRFAKDNRVATWGPRYAEIDTDLETTDLLTVSARQWRASVQRASADLERLGLPVVEVRYEDLVANPREVLSRVGSFAGLDITEPNLDVAARLVRPGRAGAGSAALSDAELAGLDAEIGGLLADLGYARPIVPRGGQGRG